MEKNLPENKAAFTPYQTFVVAVLAILQFTIILDFMVLSPLGAILLKELNIKTTEFGLVVSAYAFSAGISGLLAAGFADKFDRKKLLLFFYAGLCWAHCSAPLPQAITCCSLPASLPGYLAA